MEHLFKAIADRDAVALENRWLFPKVTRVQVFDGGPATVYGSFDATEVQAQLQDDGRTLKVFHAGTSTIPGRIRRELLEEAIAILDEDHPAAAAALRAHLDGRTPPGAAPVPEACRLCGVWECTTCGDKAYGRNRFYDGEHYCSRCRSTDGQMLPVRHRNAKRAADHNADADARPAPATYPLTEK